MSRPAELGAVIRTALQIERKYMGVLQQDPGSRERNTPWMPFNIFRFLALAAEALPELDGAADPVRYFEIGAGPGTKMMLMKEIFGFEVHGIEFYDEYAAAARSTGLDVRTVDAMSWPSYAGSGLIWFNRVYRTPAGQKMLEPLVWETASPGTVIMCANLEDRPPMSWYPVLDEWDDSRAGIWQKPFGSAAS